MTGRRPISSVSSRDSTSPTHSSQMTLYVAFPHTTPSPGRIFQIPGGKTEFFNLYFQWSQCAPSGFSSSELDPLDLIHSFLPHVFSAGGPGLEPDIKDSELT